MVGRLLLVAGIAASVGCANRELSERDREEQETTGAIEAMRSRYEMRAGPDGRIPVNALWNAKLERDAMIAHYRREAGGSSIDSPPWAWIGPGNIGGRLRSILIDPSDPNVIYVGAASGGVWKTTNGGTSWLPLDDFAPSLAIGCMIMHPSDPLTIYAGTGEGVFENVSGNENTSAPIGAGVFKTIDGGLTWNQVPSTLGSDWYFVNRMAFQPGNPSVIVAATNTGLYRSADGGTSWSHPTTAQTLDIEFNPTDAQRAVAGRNDGIAQYSTDGGVTWQNATGIAAGSTRVELAYAPTNTTIVYAAVGNGNTLRIFQSLNGGQTYTLKTTSPAAGVGTLDSYTGSLWIDPLNANTLLLGAQTAIYRSTNAGTTLTSAFSSSVHPDHHYTLQHPQYNGTTNKILYFANDGGISRTNDSAGSAATELNNNLGVTQFYGAAVNSTTGVVVGGTQDNYTLRYAGNPENWTQMYGGDGTFGCADQTDSNYFYGSSQRLNIVRSSNAGVSATSTIGGGIGDAGSLNCNFIAHFVLDPNNPQRMLAAGRSLWRTNNAKTGNPPTWTAIKPPTGPGDSGGGPGGRPRLDHFTVNNPLNISRIAVAEGNSDLVWVGHNNGQLFKSVNATATTPAWTRLDNGTTPTPARWPNAIVIDRTNTNQVYVGYQGYAAGNVWKTTDGGSTWTNISGSGPGALPAVPVSALALHRTAPGRLYAGTDIGLFLSTNDGATWAPITPGVGLVSVEELVWKNDTTLMAVTHGRGIYLGDEAVTTCYANCDASTTTPVLNVNDFICFQNRFAAGESYANCDGSSNPPILNVNDFICFQNLFAAGCP